MAKAGPQGRRAGLVAVVLIVSCIASSGILAGRGTLRSMVAPSGSLRRSPLQAPSPTATPSKEYIYAGGSLIATEEGGVSGTPTPTPTPPANAPSITQISPNSGDPGQTLTMTITGQNLDSVSGSTTTFGTISFGSSDITATVVPASSSSMSLTATVVIASTANPGTYNVSVTLAGVQSAASAASAFTVNDASAPPKLTANVSPMQGIPGAFFPMTLTGSNLSTVTQVNFAPTSGQPAGLQIGSTQIISASPTVVVAQISIADQEAVAGNYNVSVTNAGGLVSNTEPFTVVSTCPNLPTPTVSGIATSVGQGNPLFGQTFTLTVNGSNFIQGASLIYIAGQAESQTQYINATQLQCAGLSFAQAGLYSVSVINSTDVTSCATPSSTTMTLEVDNPFPVLSQISPTSVMAGSGGLNLTLTGSGFYSGSVVQFNGSIRATTFNSTNPNQLTAAITPADTANAGSATITVVNPGPGGGTSVTPRTLAIITPPVVTGVTPASATAGLTAQSVTINGMAFASSDVVKAVSTVAGSATLTPSSVNQAGTALVVSIPATMIASGGTISLTVTDNATALSSASAATFTVNNPAPAISGLNPAVLTQQSTSPTFTISGSGFVPTSQVQVNGSLCGCTSTINTTAQTITTTLTSAQVASVAALTITVFNAAPGGGISNSQTLNILPPAPAAPTGLTATAVSGGQVNLAWINNATNATSITIQRATAGGAYSPINTNVSPTATTYTDSGLAVDTLYSYQILASNAGGNSGMSNQFSATTFGAPPAAPSGLTATDSTSAPASQINLSWTDTNPNETGVKVERETGSSGFTQIAVLCPGTTSYSDTGLAGGMTYTYRIKSYNSAGDSPYSVPKGANTIALTKPAAPSGLTATAQTGLQIKLTWTNNANNQTGFIILRQLPPNGSYNQLIQVGPSVTSYTDTALSANTEYCYKVEATNSAGNSSPSNSNCATTGSSMVDQSVEDELSSNHIGSIYAYLRDSGADMPWRNAVGLLINNGAYYSPFASGSTVAPMGQPPAAPIGLAAWPIGGAQVNLSWAPGDSTQTGFILQRATASGGPFTAIASLCGAIVTYTDTGLASSTTYYYQIQATSANGNSAESNTASAATDNTPTITYISPSYVLKGSTTPYALTVNGSNFIGTSVVQVGGSARTTMFVSANQLTAALTPTDLGAAAGLAITVSNPSPAAVSNTVTLNVVANNTPTITGLSQTSVMAGSPAFNLAVTGTGFVNGSIVQVGGSARTTTFYGPAELVALITVADLANAANLPITVANPSPGTTSSATTLAVDNPAPAITSISPTSTGANAAFTLTVNGSGFVTGSVIKVNNTSVTTTLTNGVLSATVPAADIPSPGTATITVVNAAPGGGTSNSETLTLTNAIPPAPTNLTASATGPTSIQLSWTAVSNATGYKVYLVGPNGASFLASVSGQGTTTYTDNTVTSGNRFCYEVTAVNGANESPKSSEACANTP